jgi:hypothetical protein
MQYKSYKLHKRNKINFSYIASKNWEKNRWTGCNTKHKKINGVKKQILWYELFS